MSKTSDWAMDEADNAVDLAIQQCRDGFNIDKAIDILSENQTVMMFYNTDELYMIFDFEMSDEVKTVSYTHLTLPTKRIV